MFTLIFFFFFKNLGISVSLKWNVGGNAKTGKGKQRSNNDKMMEE